MQNLALFLIGAFCVTLIFGVDSHPNEGTGEKHFLDAEWKDYVKTFNKTYKDKTEADERRSIWEDNLAYITQHNKEATTGKHTYFMGVNAFTDWTFSEFSAVYLPEMRQTATPMMNNSYDLDLYFESSDDTKDWRKEGAVTPVKNQGQCGSCWAFSATGSIEGQVEITGGGLKSLSEQMLIDCCKECNGCQGGLMTLAFDCIKYLDGIDTEISYPYKAKEGTCKATKSNIKVSGYRKGNGESYLHAVVQQKGPASVAMMATHNLQHYRSGVFSDFTCNTGKVNHGVLVVGYGDGYWLVKNSWGTGWGMDGYFMIKRGYSYVGMCMIASDISYPFVSFK